MFPNFLLQCMFSWWKLSLQIKILLLVLSECWLCFSSFDSKHHLRVLSFVYFCRHVGKIFWFRTHRVLVSWSGQVAQADSFMLHATCPTEKSYIFCNASVCFCSLFGKRCNFPLAFLKISLDIFPTEACSCLCNTQQYTRPSFGGDCFHYLFKVGLGKRKESPWCIWERKLTCLVFYSALCCHRCIANMLEKQRTQKMSTFGQSAQRNYNSIGMRICCMHSKARWHSLNRYAFL